MKKTLKRESKSAEIVGRKQMGLAVRLTRMQNVNDGLPHGSRELDHPAIAQPSPHTPFVENRWCGDRRLAPSGVPCGTACIDDGDGSSADETTDQKCDMLASRRVKWPEGAG
ncbi:hypothetical protein HPP92_013241 [Vanilla planifolia]|nr:hypothetical protein HPP92_013241 [Vanilla planifolia]